MSNSNTPSRIEMIQPDDWHLHIRDGDVMKDVLADTARQFARAIIMPNLKPPVTTVDLAKAYQSRIDANLKTLGINSFTPLMTLYLTDNTSADEVRKAKAEGIAAEMAEAARGLYGSKIISAVVPVPASSSNSDADLSDLVAVKKEIATHRAQIDAAEQIPGECARRLEVTDKIGRAHV